MPCPKPAATRTPPAVEVGDVFRAHGETYRQRHALTPEQSKVLHALSVCRTSVLGGHLDVCPTCGHQAPSYNSCRDRHCPKCQSLVQAEWLEQRMARILPVHYFHVVFTLPAPLRPIARRAPEVIYGLLFDTASRTLQRLGEDPKRLGAQLAFTAILHTWTRELAFHPHLHCVVSGGGFARDTARWVDAHRKFLFPVKVMAALFRGLFLDGLRRTRDQGKIEIPDPDWKPLLDTLYATSWVVYAKPPFGGPEQVFRYLGRYTHRVGISNQRLRSIDARGVTFATRNGRVITLPPEEFIRRFLLHVLPAGFVKIRHYGLWSAGHVNTRLAEARQCLDSSLSLPASTDPPPIPAPTSASTASPTESAPPAPPAWYERLLRLTGIDVFLCPRCQRGRLERRPLPPPGTDTS